VLGVYLLLDDLVFLCKLLTFCLHSGDVFRRKATRIILNRDHFLLSSALFNCAYGQNTVCINLEGNFDLWYSSLSWRDVSHVKLSKAVIMLCLGTLTFKDRDINLGLLVLVSGEGLFLYRGDHCTTRNDFRHNTTNGLNTK